MINTEFMVVDRTDERIFVRRPRVRDSHIAAVLLVIIGVVVTLWYFNPSMSNTFPMPETDAVVFSLKTPPTTGIVEKSYFGPVTSIKWGGTFTQWNGQSTRVTSNSSTALWDILGAHPEYDGHRRLEGTKPVNHSMFKGIRVWSEWTFPIGTYRFEHNKPCGLAHEHCASRLSIFPPPQEPNRNYSVTVLDKVYVCADAPCPL